MRTVTKVENTLPRIKQKKKVAAYARISMESERMNHSLSAQISYYNNLIQKNPDWEFAGIYAELLLTIMSSLAQEESRSISENVTWGHKT